MTAYLATKLVAPTVLERVLVATPSPVGPTGYGLGYTYTGTTASPQWTNGSIYAFGAVFRATSTGIYRSTDGGETWALVLTFTASSAFCGGIYPVYDGAGVMRLCAVTNGSGNILHGYVSLTGLAGSWSDSNTGITVGAETAGFPCVWRGAVWGRQSAAGGQGYWSFNPASLTSSVTPNQANGTGSDADYYMIVWNDTLYVLSAVGGTSALNLATIVGGTVINGPTILAGLPRAISACVDPTTGDLVVVFVSGGGWKAYSVTSALVITDRTANMITGGTLAGFSVTNSKVAGVYYDQDANPGGPPAIYFLIAAGFASGTPVSAFKFNGFGAGAGANLLGTSSGAPNDTGGDLAFAWADKNVGGERFFTPVPQAGVGTPDIWNTGKGALATGVTRRKFSLIAPRSQILTTIGGSPATYNLVGTAITPTPIRARYTTIRGTIGGIVHVATDIATAGVLAAPGTTTTAVVALPQATLAVVSTGLTTAGPQPAFPSAGTIVVVTSGGPQTVAYTGITATTFTGCTGGTGNTSIGGAVTGGLLPTAGTIDTAGNLTGTTGTLDAGTVVEALSTGGTASNQWYRSVATDDYPGNTVAAPLTLPTTGAISGGNTNTGCTADATEQQISVGMSGITAGDRVAIDPRALS